MPRAYPARRPGCMLGRRAAAGYMFPECSQFRETPHAQPGQPAGAERRGPLRYRDGAPERREAVAEALQARRPRLPRTSIRGPLQAPRPRHSRTSRTLRPAVRPKTARPGTQHAGFPGCGRDRSRFDCRARRWRLPSPWFRWFHRRARAPAAAIRPHPSPLPLPRKLPLQRSRVRCSPSKPSAGARSP